MAAAVSSAVSSTVRKIGKYNQFIAYAYGIAVDALTDFAPTEPSRIIHFTELPTELQIGNGASWFRSEAQKNKRIKIASFRKDGKDKGAIIALQAIPDLEFNPSTSTRSIRDDIRKEILQRPCVSCGTNSRIEVDHKNDLYNDPRVLCLSTQELNDFQPLCKHCNDQKRQVIKRTKETGRRYAATNIPALAPFGIDFIKGDETYDPEDIHAMEGTYWYDPVEFATKIKQIIYHASS